jgi:transaldolase
MVCRDDGLVQLAAEGVAPWLDGLSREVIASGRLTDLVGAATLLGVTSNVDVFGAAMAGDRHYRDQLTVLARQDIPVELAARSLSAHDARLACAELWPVFVTTREVHGHVSVDLDPTLTAAVESTVRGAVDLTRLVDRANLLVKIRATDQGVLAIRECLGIGIGVHASDIFSVRRYGEVLDAYFDGLERAVAAGLRASGMGMITSMPVGRIDAEFDAQLTAVGAAATCSVRGQGALAVARLAYQAYDQRLGTERWRALSVAGAHPPRLMWTDTAATDPNQSPTRYVDEFVAWGTASAMSLSTLDAMLRGSGLHGDTLTGQHEHAAAVLAEFDRLGVSQAAVADRLGETSARRHDQSWRRLREQVAAQLKAVRWTCP